MNFKVMDSNKCKCNTKNDEHGNHALKCNVGGKIGRRHNIFRDILAKESNFAGYIAQKEVKGLLENSNAKPADILIKEFINGKDTVIDTTVGHSLVKYKCSTMETLEKIKSLNTKNYVLTFWSLN